MITLDGSFGEGGGQILRTSLALALLTGQPFQLRRIRARRSKPGLQPQHLMSVRAAATIGQAQTHGDALHSRTLVFEPGAVKPGKHQFEIGTAGATGLVLQTIYLPLALRARAPSEITLTGGTHVRASPCFDFLDTTWRVYLEQLGLRLRLHLGMPGFYPRGGGTVDAHIQPSPQLQGLHLTDCGRITAATVVSAAAFLPEHIVRRQARRAVEHLQQLGLEVTAREEMWSGGPGTVVTITLNSRPVPTLFFSLGALGKPAERVADEAVDQVAAYLNVSPSAVDAHSADQLVLPLALAEGTSSFRTIEVTSHLLTNIEVIRRFLDREITCEGEEGEPGLVRILG
jgi:RNA 3'-terminal phosphate cyclase (ATP)